MQLQLQGIIFALNQPGVSINLSGQRWLCDLLSVLGVPGFLVMWYLLFDTSCARTGQAASWKWLEMVSEAASSCLEIIYFMSHLLAWEGAGNSQEGFAWLAADFETFSVSEAKLCLGRCQCQSVPWSYSLLLPSFLGQRSWCKTKEKKKENSGPWVSGWISLECLKYAYREPCFSKTGFSELWRWVPISNN